MTRLQIIKSDKEYESLFAWVDQQFDLAVQPNSKVSEKLQVALLLIKHYEDVHCAIPTFTV